MLATLAENWWSIAARGTAAVIFGLAAIIWPQITLAILIYLFGAFAIVDGVFALFGAARAARRQARWWTMVVEGVIGVTIGVLSMVIPAVTALVLLFFIAYWAIFIGLLRLFQAVQLRGEIQNEWLLALSGALSVTFGLVLLAFPSAGAVTLVTVIGIFAVIVGALTIGFAMRLRSWMFTSDEDKRKAA